MNEIDNKNKIEINKRKSKLKPKHHVRSANDNNIINLLLDFPFIKILPSYIIQEIHHSITEQHFRIHEVVLKQGDPISNLYIVNSGSFIFTINHESIAQMSQDIHSFIQYQAITEEPFLEKRKYELNGKIVNTEQIPIFIYQEKKFFGDIEIVSGRNTSMFNIVANEDNSSLYVIDRIKWVRLTKRIRIMFTRMTLKKIEMIYERIFEVLKGKNYLNIDKMKLYKDKIHEQIEITNNFDIYSKKIQKKEKKLQNELDKIKLNKQNEKLKEEKSKSLRNFQYSKEYLINLFKFPNILKEDKKSDLEKYLFVNKNRDTQRFKLRNTISKFNIEPDLAKNNIISNNENKNNKSKLFMTIPMKQIKSYSTNNIFDTIKTQKTMSRKRMNQIILKEGKNPPADNSSSLMNFYKSSTALIKHKEQKLSSKSLTKNSSLGNNNSPFPNNNNENLYSQKMRNLLLQTILNRENQMKKVMIKPLAKKGRNLLLLKRNQTIISNSEYKREKMNKEQIDNMLKQRYNSIKDKLINKLLGQKEDEDSTL